MNETDSKMLTEQDVDDWFDSEDQETSERELTDDELSRRYTDSQIRIVRSNLDFTLHTLSDSMQDESYINLTPVYQRRMRWDKRKKSRLIESFLMNIPVPPLFLFEKDYNQYEVMDGRQRLAAILGFLKNEYPLTDLEFWPQLQGKFYSDLPDTIRRGLRRRTINAVVLLAETSRGIESPDIRLILFRRLNTGGVKLNPQELRNALYPGFFNEALQELAKEPTFADLWGIPHSENTTPNEISAKLAQNTLHQSMMDCELVLRFFAIRDACSGMASGSLRQIFDKTMRRYSLLSESEVHRLKDEFRDVLYLVTDSLGPAFHHLLNGRPSRPLYDAILVAAIDFQDPNFKNNASAIKSEFESALLETESYEILVGRGNTLEAIKQRVGLARSILRKWIP